MLTIQERIKDLRNDHGLTLEQLAEQTGLSSSALGNYETNEYKDISHFAIIKLAKFYGVTTDYLLGLSETKKHSKADINSLRLSDEMIELLQQGKINIPLFCELATHKDFPKLLADIEIYVNRFASKVIQFLNSYRRYARPVSTYRSILRKNPAKRKRHPHYSWRCWVQLLWRLA